MRRFYPEVNNGLMGLGGYELEPNKPTNSINSINPKT